MGAGFVQVRDLDHEPFPQVVLHELHDDQAAQLPSTENVATFNRKRRVIWLITVLCQSFKVDA